MAERDALPIYKGVQPQEVEKTTKQSIFPPIASKRQVDISLFDSTPDALKGKN